MQLKKYTFTISIVFSALLVSGCELDRYRNKVVIDPLFANDPETLERKEFKTGDNQIETIFGQFLLAQQDAIEPAADVEEQKANFYAFSATTIAASDAACDILFATLHRLSKDTEMAQGAMNMIGNAAGATLGLLDASSEALGGLAIALGAGNASFELFNERFMLSPALPSLHKKVVEARKELANTLRVEATTYKSYPEAEGQLRSYHLTCSPIYLADIIAKSVDVAPFKPNVELPKQAERLSTVSSELYSLAYGQSGAFTRNQLRNLAEVFLSVRGASATELTKVVNARLTADNDKKDRALVLLDSVADVLGVQSNGTGDEGQALANIGITVGN
ncbi:hypothetical protein [Thalassospira australica]|uniref:hypothetical protein n=1 Tax=Thalassospira australica TaxID=1528106 RepID=UPI00051A7765|nr:hypothetical protein [Thalassospira australica]